MKKLILLSSVVLVIVILLNACNKDKNDNPAPSGPKEVKYELVGTYTGKINIVYTNEVGSATTTETTSLPWTKTVTVQASVATALIGITAGPAGSGTVGLPGQTVTGNVYLNGTLSKTSGVQTAISSGFFNVSAY